jgi:hypothetical protein
MNMTPDRRDMVDGQSNPYNNQWRASILGLQPVTEYEVRVTLYDDDGVTGTNPLTETVTTRNDNPSPLNPDNTPELHPLVETYFNYMIIR